MPTTALGSGETLLFGRSPSSAVPETDVDDAADVGAQTASPMLSP